MIISPPFFFNSKNFVSFDFQLFLLLLPLVQKGS
jgi:hypothetical protein